MITRKKLQVLFHIFSERVCQIRVVRMEKKIRIESNRKVSQTRQVLSSRKMELHKPLSIRKGKGPMTYNKKQKTNEKSCNSETKKRYCCLEENKEKSITYGKKIFSSSSFFPVCI